MQNWSLDLCTALFVLNDSILHYKGKHWPTVDAVQVLLTSRGVLSTQATKTSRCDMNMMRYAIRVLRDFVQYSHSLVFVAHLTSRESKQGVASWSPKCINTRHVAWSCLVADCHIRYKRGARLQRCVASFS